MIEYRSVCGSSYYGSFTVSHTKLLKNVGSGEGGREVGRSGGRGMPYIVTFSSRVPGSVSHFTCFGALKVMVRREYSGRGPCQGRNYLSKFLSITNMNTRYVYDKDHVFNSTKSTGQYNYIVI